MVYHPNVLLHFYGKFKPNVTDGFTAVLIVHVVIKYIIQAVHGQRSFCAMLEYVSAKLPVVRPSQVMPQISAPAFAPSQ